tara:strand:+ start:445 stop:750 length:306 start_codon:yes stop_codon:yes gene_type:complete
VDNRLNYSSRTLRAIANNGLPLKINAQWTENDYWERRHPDSDEMDCVAVRGWLIRINGKKYPRQLGEDGIDWTYRFTAPRTEEGMQTAIKNALSEARLEIC